MYTLWTLLVLAIVGPLTFIGLAAATGTNDGARGGLGFILVIAIFGMIATNKK
jgi:hypothetical protein